MFDHYSLDVSTCKLQKFEISASTLYSFSLSRLNRVTNKVSALDSGRAVRVGALAGDIVLCSWRRHFTLTVTLFSQVFKWVSANLMLDELASHPGEGGERVELLLIASCYRNRDKLRPDGPLDSYADFTLPFTLLFLLSRIIKQNYFYLSPFVFS